MRTAAEGATEEQLTLDVQRLTSQWAEIEHAVETQQAPALLHSEPDLLIKIVRDVFNEDFQKLVIEGDDALDTIASYVGAVAPDLVDRIETLRERASTPSTSTASREQIEKALDRKVWLPSGGSLVIDRTEAMTVVDVNTGKFVGSGGNLEETVTKNNLEAAEEIVRQLRLRDIGGIIVVDFIDMVLETQPRPRAAPPRRVPVSRDRTKHQVAEVTSLGLVQMTRKKLGLGLRRVVQRELRGLRRSRHHHPPRAGVQAPRRREPIGSSAAAAERRHLVARPSRTRRLGRRRRLAELAPKNGTARPAPTRSPKTCATRSPRSRRARCRTPSTSTPSVDRSGRRARAEPGAHRRSRRRGRRARPPSRSSTSRCPREGVARRAARSARRMPSRSSARCSRRFPSRSSPDRVACARSRRAVERRAAVVTPSETRRVAQPARQSRSSAACVTRSPRACSRRSSSRPVTGSAPSAMSASRRSRGTS